MSEMIPLMCHVRAAEPSDHAAIGAVEASARDLLAAQGVDLSAIEVPPGLDEPVDWAFAFVAEVGGEVVGAARLAEAGDGCLILEQLSVAHEFARKGVGSLLLGAVVAHARALGYRAILGTTFRDVVFNAPLYRQWGATEDPTPPPALARRLEVERRLGLTAFGERIAMRLALGD